ncbi:cytochrome P450 [Saccharothrix australiensis]|uniref:Cytochrome P450 n=1 Tax=Saccharothrix australiensis TaxID=2072 RepID=A0A495VY26_9PSEU|nr:cytochrome P450 [Saccharothrix australiensis]RKT52518.1 cytochrome P450 [Saccharothrix australiensis]
MPSDVEVIVDPDTYTRGVPHDALTRLRDAGVVRAGGFVGVFRHADVRTVLRRPQVFSSWLGGTQLRDPATPGDLAYVRRMMLNTDPPEHTRLRGLLTKAFTPRAVAALEARIARWARELVAPLADGEPRDFTALAADLPLRTLAEVFGVPHRDRALMYDWSNRVIGYQDADYAHSSSDTTGMSEMALRALALRPDPQPDPRARGGMPDLYAYAHALGELKRREPGDDVMSNLMRHDVAVEEFETLFWLFSVAGNETVRNGIPGGLIALLRHPDQYALLKRDRALLPGAVEEMLRWWTPVMHFRRTAAADTELAGAGIRRGEKVVVWFSSANRDERVFTEPHRFDVTRAAGEHLSFGHGPHFCLGAHLARVQLRALFDAVLDLPGPLVPAGGPTRLRSNFQNGVKSLPVRHQLRS